jgi:hydroxymethylpyrimidine pyrophosphatase-like HAD family hydrolase
MHYRVLACDYDGTLATHGVVDPETISSLRRWLDHGRKLLLVTGRELPELKTVFPEVGLCDYVVAENGGLLYHPATSELKVLAPPPPQEFLAALIARGVGPISVGHSILATWEPHQHTVLETIRELGLELQVIFNKGAVMILPTGVNKATGLAAALRVLEMSRHAVAAVGDAENDHAFLQHARLGVAVSNALPALKQRADFVTAGDHGRGVQELIDHLLKNDFAEVTERLTRHSLALPAINGGAARHWFPGQQHLVIAGDQEAVDIVSNDISQRLSRAGYQHCRFLCGPVEQKPEVEADTPGKMSLASVGSAEQLPTVADVLRNLTRPDQNVQVHLCAVGAADRHQRLNEIWTALQQFARERGRPHVLLLPAANAFGLKPAEWTRGFPSIVTCVGPDHDISEVFAADDNVLRLDASVWLNTPLEATP